MDFFELEELGRVRLSKHFFMRDFLHSEIAVKFRITNVPDNPDLAIEAGHRLCSEILEPIVETFGPIHIRSGFRSARLNAFGAKLRLNCSRNQRNFAYHIWDHLDEEGGMGAAACIVVPWLLDNARSVHDWRMMGAFAHRHLPYHRMTFFKRNFAFNIGWHERPNRDVMTWYPKRAWLVRGDALTEEVSEADVDRWLERLPEFRNPGSSFAA